MDHWCWCSNHEEPSRWVRHRAGNPFAFLNVRKTNTQLCRSYRPLPRRNIANNMLPFSSLHTIQGAQPRCTMTFNSWALPLWLLQRPSYSSRMKDFCQSWCFGFREDVSAIYVHSQATERGLRRNRLQCCMWLLTLRRRDWSKTIIMLSFRDQQNRKFEADDSQAEEKNDSSSWSGLEFRELCASVPGG